MPFPVRKALVTAAGPNQRRLPLQPLADSRGEQKPAILLLAEEAFAAGIEQLGLVLAPGDRADYAAALAPFASRVVFLEQAEPLGYGHALLCGREFIGAEAFLLQVSDHLYLSASDTSCTRQLLGLAAAEGCAISAVQATHESQLPYYGTVAGALLPGRRGLYQVEGVHEKPTPTFAEQHCLVPGLRRGHYLCFFGLHVLTPAVFDLLAEDARAAGKIGLSPALHRLAQGEKYLAAELEGRRSNLEANFGFLRTQVALGLHGERRSEVLAILAEELAAAAAEQPISAVNRRAP